MFGDKLLNLCFIFVIFIFLIVIMNVFKKTKKCFNLQRKKILRASVSDKRELKTSSYHYFYVTFKVDDEEKEYLVTREKYHLISINEEGNLILLDDYFYDFQS